MQPALQRAVCVVGGGPAGCLVAATAARRGLEVTWCDDTGFRAGMLQRYMDVPANTKLLYLRDQGFFDTGAEITRFAAEHPPLRLALADMYAKVIENPENMQEWDPTPPEAVADGSFSSDHHQPQHFLPNGWPNMRQVVRLFEAVSCALSEMPNVRRVDGRCIKADWHTQTNTWHVQMKSSSAAAAENVKCTANAHALVMCLGGKPRVIPELQDALDRLPSDVPTPIVLDSEQGLDAQTLASAVSCAADAAGERAGTRAKIAVIGNSHTAALVLRNLDSALGYGFPDVTVHAREPVLLAEWLNEPGTYKFSAHGLKGLAASFALQDLNKGKQSLLGLHGTGRAMVDLWSRIQDGHYGLVVSCCGFEYNRIPDLFEIACGVDVPEEIESQLFQYDPKTASLDASRKLFQCGMTSPEYFVDVHDAAFPVTGITGGKETEVEGWAGQRLLSWAFFNKRAAQIVDEILK